MIVGFGCKPRSAQFRRAFGSCYASIGKILLQPSAERVRVDRITVKKATHEHDLWREQVKAGRDRLGVLAKDARAFFDNLDHPPIAAGCRFKHHWGERG